MTDAGGIVEPIVSEVWERESLPCVLSLLEADLTSERNRTEWSVAQAERADDEAHDRRVQPSSNRDFPHSARCAASFFSHLASRVDTHRVGTTLPPSLTILHEHTDHYSLQTTKRIGLDELNAEMTRFFAEQCEAYSKEEWLESFGRLGEKRGARRW